MTQPCEPQIEAWSFLHQHIAPTYIQWRRVMRQYESLFFPIQFLHQRKLRLDDSGIANKAAVKKTTLALTLACVRSNIGLRSSPVN
ncbi:hypothetical protein HAX54_001322 [Datura stramonium]|uniref:Uncharacterized protein n=1 Tax=Datura stramonium TaxID=4076 RepID=A0ABS8RSV6_DATST|nr:hypothetical protein [Datura stramonium]